MKYIDISHSLDNNTPVYPGDINTALTKYRSIETDSYNAYLLQTGLHSGTHIDMPMHLIDDDKKVKDYSVDNFVGNGVLLDVRGEAIITMKAEYEKVVQEQDIVLLYTGFDKHYGDPSYFTEHPIISDGLADFFIEKRIKMLGFDMPSPDKPPFKLHKALLKNGIFLLENLTNLNSLVGYKHFEVIALPIKIAAEASLVRAVCKVK